MLKLGHGRVGQCTRYELEIGPSRARADDRILRFFYGDICIFVLKDVPAAITAVASRRAAPGRAGKDKEFGDAEGGLEFLAVVGIIRLQFSRRRREAAQGRMTDPSFGGNGRVIRTTRSLIYEHARAGL